jgi:hypothetical protein
MTAAADRVSPTLSNAAGSGALGSANLSTTIYGLLSFVGPLKPQVDRGHSRRDVYQRDRTQGEPVSPEPGEAGVLLPAPLALALELLGGDQARRHPRACRGPLEERQVGRL